MLFSISSDFYISFVISSIIIKYFQLLIFNVIWRIVRFMHTIFEHELVSCLKLFKEINCIKGFFSEKKKNKIINNERHKSVKLTIPFLHLESKSVKYILTHTRMYISTFYSVVLSLKEYKWYKLKLRCTSISYLSKQ